jgi:hypothetical protein
MPSTLATAPSPPSRRTLAQLWDEPQSRSIAIGLLGVLLFHLFLFAVAPHLLRTDPIRTVARRQAIPKQFNIEIAPDTFAKALPKPPPAMKFVETNPNAPENVPDKTNNFAAQNQQAAQEKPQADAHNDRARTEGKKDFQSNQIVSGQLSKPQEPVPIAPAVQQPVKSTAAPRQEQNPLTGFDKSKTQDADGFGSNIAKVPDNPKPIPERIEGAKDTPLLEGAPNSQIAIDPKKPRPRPALEHIQVRPAVFQDNPIGTSNMGISGIDARWSNYGAYLQKLINAVQEQWDRILIESRTNPPPGSQVSVRFRLDSKGLVAEVLDVQSSSTEQGKAACVSAITSRAPYGDWTDDMIALLGTSQELTFTFLYQ